MNRRALLAIADMADALARLAREAASDAPVDADALLPLDDAAAAAGTSKRVLRDAIRAGELPAFGKQRDRSVRREDLDVWIESRRLPVKEGPADDDIDRRISRIQRERERRSPSKAPGQGRVG
jgi:hypothetical protein